MIAPHYTTTETLIMGQKTRLEQYDSSFLAFWLEAARAGRKTARYEKRRHATAARAVLYRVRKLVMIEQPKLWATISHLEVSIKATSGAEGADLPAELTIRTPEQSLLSGPLKKSLGTIPPSPLQSSPVQETQETQESVYPDDFLQQLLGELE